MSAAVSIVGATFAYADGAHRTGPIDLTVEPGERVAVVGPNGAGKTTLLRLLAGQLEVESGSVRVCGCDPTGAGQRELARRVAVVGPQSLIGFPYSVEEVVLMGRAPHVDGFRLESDHDLEVAHAAMAAMEVEAMAARDFDSLSSGEKQRVAVARALAQEPEVLLLDEPGAFLDIKHQTLLYDHLTRLATERRIAEVCVLHDLNLAALFFDKVVMLAAGRIFASGAPDEVITYANLREVFDTDVYVALNDLTGHLNVLPLPPGHGSAHSK